MSSHLIGAHYGMGFGGVICQCERTRPSLLIQISNETKSEIKPESPPAKRHKPEQPTAKSPQFYTWGSLDVQDFVQQLTKVT